MGEGASPKANDFGIGGCDDASDISKKKAGGGSGNGSVLKSGLRWLTAELVGWAGSLFGRTGRGENDSHEGS